MENFVTNFSDFVFLISTYLHRLLDGLSGDDTRGLDTNTLSTRGIQRTCSINGVTQSVNDTAQKLGTDGNVDNGTSTLDHITFLDQLVVTY